MVAFKSNTTKEFPCIFCGGPGNIIREDPTNPRLKCLQCNGMYDGKDSIDAKDAGMIPDGKPKLDDPAPTPKVEQRPTRVEENAAQVPKSVAYAFMSRDRSVIEFCSRRDFKKMALKWAHLEGNYDCFELVPKKISAKIDIQ